MGFLSAECRHCTNKDVKQQIWINWKHPFAIKAVPERCSHPYRFSLLRKSKFKLYSLVYKGAGRTRWECKHLTPLNQRSRGFKINWDKDIRKLSHQPPQKTHQTDAPAWSKLLWIARRPEKEAQCLKRYLRAIWRETEPKKDELSRQHRAWHWILMCRNGKLANFKCRLYGAPS